MRLVVRLVTETVVPMLMQELARAHRLRGVKPEYFSIAGKAIMYVAQQANLTKWSFETEAAWRVCISMIVRPLQKSLEAEIARHGGSESVASSGAAVSRARILAAAIDKGIDGGIDEHVTFDAKASKIACKAWKLVMKDVEVNRGRFFRRLFEISDEAKMVFASFVSVEEPLEQNSRLNGHADKVFDTIGKCVNGVADYDRIKPYLEVCCVWFLWILTDPGV